MPGVPSGTGCDGCRRQKKKASLLGQDPAPCKKLTFLQCDEIKPACSRCRRLRIACNGGGQRRFKFVDPAHKRPFNSSTVVSLIAANSRRLDRSLIHKPPGNESSLQLSTYLSTIKPSVNFRHNLAWNYGAFLEEIPQRLGKNKALDTAVAALVSAHSNVCCRRRATLQTLVKYSVALHALKSSLNSPHEASSSETLCAIMVLLICQVRARKSLRTLSYILTQAEFHWRSCWTVDWSLRRCGTYVASSQVSNAPKSIRI